MNLVVAPARVAAMEQAYVPVRIALAMLEPAPEEPVAPRHRIREVTRRHKLRPYRCAQFRRHALVRVQAKDPVVRSLRDREILLPPETEPRLFDDPRPAAARDFYGIIAAAGIDHDRLRREGRRTEAAGNFGGGITSDHHCGQCKGGKRI